MQFGEFYRDVPDIALKNNWRLGQAFFNHLLDCRPDLAEILRQDKSKNPFYSRDRNDPRYQKALVFVREMWDQADTAE